MIDALDAVLRRLFTSRVATITTDEQVLFRPPNAGWVSDVINLQQNVLNVYLVELRENRALRSNDPVREVREGRVMVSPAPRRIDCHYLITAWSPADEAMMLEPTLDEHGLLYRTVAALMEAEPLVPRRIFADALPAGFPPAIADAELPIQVISVDGFPKYAEFWGTMGAEQPWRAGIYLVVTLPVVFGSIPSGPPVTTLVSEYRRRDTRERGDVLVQIGGVVLDRAGAILPDAWVRLQTTDAPSLPLQTVRSDERGRFTFAGLRVGTYQLRARAAGQGATVPLTVDVPSESGEYDLRFS